MNSSDVCSDKASHLSAPPSLSSTFRPLSSYSALESQKDSLSFMMLASTAPPMNTMCLRCGGSSMRILNFCGRESCWRMSNSARLEQNKLRLIQVFSLWHIACISTFIYIIYSFIYMSAAALSLAFLRPLWCKTAHLGPHVWMFCTH